MKTITAGKHTVELFDAIDELPMSRFHKYNKMLLIDSGIGSDIADIDRHLERAALYIQNKETDNAVAEINNMRQNVYFIQQNVSPKCLAFAVLVTKIDGKACDDISDDGLRATAAKLNDMTVGEFDKVFDEAKKKIDAELRAYFPGLFDDADSKQFADELKQRTLAILDTIINGKSKERTAKIEKMTVGLMLYNEPRVFAGADNFEIKHDKQYERMNIM